MIDEVVRSGTKCKRQEESTEHAEQNLKDKVKEARRFLLHFRLVKSVSNKRDVLKGFERNDFFVYIVD